MMQPVNKADTNAATIKTCLDGNTKRISIAKNATKYFVFTTKSQWLSISQNLQKIPYDFFKVEVDLTKTKTQLNFWQVRINKGFFVDYAQTYYLSG